MTNPKPYEGHGYDNEGKPYISGPGNGFGYYAGTLWPDSRFASKEAAEAAAKLCNEAYSQGYRKAQQDIRIALGIPE